MLILDANILIRGVLGVRVLSLICKYADHVDLLAPDSAYREAREQLLDILDSRGVPLAPAMKTLDLIAALVPAVELNSYAAFEAVAHQRIDRRDKDDWPMVALALSLDCPIWTEDSDFFGCGVATWTTDRVELYLSEVAARLPR